MTMREFDLKSDGERVFEGSVEEGVAVFVRARDEIAKAIGSDETICLLALIGTKDNIKACAAFAPMPISALVPVIKSMVDALDAERARLVRLVKEMEPSDRGPGTYDLN